MWARVKGWFRRRDDVVFNQMSGVGPLICPHCGENLAPITVRVMSECAAMAERLAKAIRKRAADLEKDA
jgi:hypothetical protein